MKAVYLFETQEHIRNMMLWISKDVAISAERPADGENQIKKQHRNKVKRELKTFIDGRTTYFYYKGFYWRRCLKKYTMIWKHLAAAYRGNPAIHLESWL